MANLLLKTELFSGCPHLPPSQSSSSQGSFPPAGTISQGCCFAFVFQLAKLLAQGQAHERWWGLMESVCACWCTLLNWAGASKHGQGTNCRDVTHSLPPCCLGQTWGRAGQQKQTFRRESQLTHQPCAHGARALARASDVSWYPFFSQRTSLGKANLFSITD